MAKETKCVMPGCGGKPHSKGYCRKHYGQLWRRGKAIAFKGEGESSAPSAASREDTDRMRALERELRRAEMMYQNVIGFEGRLRWRREIGEVKNEMARLGMKPAPLPSPAERPAVPALGALTV